MVPVRPKLSQRNFTFKLTIIIATVHAVNLSHVGLTNSPIFSRLLVKVTNGITAKDS